MMNDLFFSKKAIVVRIFFLVAACFLAVAVTLVLSLESFMSILLGLLVGYLSQVLAQNYLRRL